MKSAKSWLLTAAVVCAFPAFAHAGSFTLTNATPGIFDASSGTRSVTVTGLELGFDSGILTGLTISIDYLKADGESANPPRRPRCPAIRFTTKSISGSIARPIPAPR